GCGSFQAKWTLPKGGSRLGMDIIWETRVRYKTPPYFWFAIWTCGNKWNRGAEIDVVEAFGYDNGGNYTNYDGRYWHVGIVGGREDIPYKSWSASMSKMGVKEFDATKYHTWTLVYKADNTIAVYMDGILVQTGFSHWTLGTKPDGEEFNMSFLFDGGWGHTKVKSVDKTLPASAFEGTFYEWDYSRVYLRKAAKVSK
ncbi:MAG: family 16 glycosylhydrolase, partial [Planctomycetes bacterium]|nr:family 16 glycosylhydrolase [Planctomycetota bacterium]